MVRYVRMGLRMKNELLNVHFSKSIMMEKFHGKSQLAVIYFPLKLQRASPTLA